MQNIKIGNSFVTSEVLASYVGAVHLSNSRAANFIERSQISAALAPAAMPAEILGRMTVLELAVVPYLIAEHIVKAVRDRERQQARAADAVL